MIESIDSRAISAIPFLDFPLAIAARIFAIETRLEKASSQADLSQVSKGHLSEISLGVCNSLLSRLSE
jgi:phospholipid N-methyltransferase